MMDKIGIKVLKVELSHHAQFALPSIRLLTAESGLYDRLLRRMLPFGAGLADLRVETAVQNIADAAVSCWLFQFTTLVRVRAERFEINYTKIPEQDVQDRLIVQVFEAVKESDPGIEILSHTITLNLHGKLDEGIPSADFLSQYVKAAPTGLGPTSGSGFIYYFPGHEKRQASSLIMEPSRLYPGGLFVQGVTIFDAKQIPLQDVMTAAWDYYRAAGEHFGLEEGKVNHGA
ncbi:MAG: hypothetical protein O6837_08165 [Deltaproteobacteria bacterium]|nr:hypothetical protein [candidate division NC10 bacterium]MCZ6548076.1 hypothetical protein [Deltaproteobacteria bacterium]